MKQSVAARSAFEHHRDFGSDGGVPISSKIVLSGKSWAAELDYGKKDIVVRD